MEPKNIDHDGDGDNLMQEAKCVKDKRKLHKSYMTIWSSQVSVHGNAKCLIQTCNFISSDVSVMQEHYKSCDGVPQHDVNLCHFCKSWVNSYSELIIHKLFCKGGYSNTMESPKNDGKVEAAGCIENRGRSVQSSCESRLDDNSRNVSVGGERSVVKALKHCKQCNQDFMSDADFSCHLKTCRRKQGQMETLAKSSEDANMCSSGLSYTEVNEEFDENRIIQPNRDIPKGQYVRRRAYTKQHKSAWEAAIKKYNHVKCIFQNCHFLAMSVEDMISHFGYCNGDGSFARFICPYCEGRVTSEKILEIHIMRSHNLEHHNSVNSHFLDIETFREDECQSLETDCKDFLSCDIIEYPDEAELIFSDETKSDLQMKERPSSDCEELCFASRDLLNSEEGCSSFRDLSDKSRLLKHKSSIEGQSDNVNDSSCEGNVSVCTSHEGEQVFLDEQDEFIVGDTSVNFAQRVQNSAGSVGGKNYKDDHIYFKRKGKVVTGDPTPAPSLTVMKNSNLKHYSGPRNISGEPSNEKDDEINDGEESAGTEKEEDLLAEEEISESITEMESDNTGKYVRQMIKFSFPSVQNGRRKIRQCFTNMWTESIKAYGFARCLVATCNFISLDIFHIQNHFKTCNGVPAKGPNLCSYCNSWLPSVFELSIHASKCKTNGELVRSGTSQGNEDGTDKKYLTGQGTIVEGDSGTGGKGEPNLCAEADEVTDSNVNSYGRDSGSKSSSKAGTNSKKEKVASLRISDIMKLKDSGIMDLNRIIQPGPVLPKGQYLRRRAYSKQHKAVWQATLEKHKYVKCIFQNCHFLAMSLEDMIYHFGYCIGDGSFAKFECPYCGGRLTTKVVLDIHIRVSHPEKVTDESMLPLLQSNGDTDYTSELMSSLDELKQLVTAKEIKTYARQYNRSKTVQCADTAVKIEPADSVGDEDFNFESVELAADQNYGRTNPGSERVTEDCGIRVETANSMIEPLRNHGDTSGCSVESNSSAKPDFLGDLGQSDETSIAQFQARSMSWSDNNSQGGCFVGESSIVEQTGKVKIRVGLNEDSEGSKDPLFQNVEDDDGLSKGGNSRSPEQCESIRQSDSLIINSGDGVGNPNTGSDSDKVIDHEEVGSISERRGHTNNKEVALPVVSGSYEEPGGDGNTIKECENNKEKSASTTLSEHSECLALEKASSSDSNEKAGNEDMSQQSEGEKPTRKRSRKTKSVGLPAGSSSGDCKEKLPEETEGISDGQRRSRKRKTLDEEDLKEEPTDGLNDSQVEENVNPKRKKANMSESDKEDISNAAVPSAECRTRKTPKNGHPNGQRNCTDKPAILEVQEPVTKGGRGRKRKTEIPPEAIVDGPAGEEEVKCAMCNFRTKRRLYSDHNFRKHVGLSWIEGDPPIDMDNEELISYNIKQAFKFVKSATCKKCSSVKKSALGFISHVQNCGKSDEEKEALKVTCPHCPARILKYSLPMHLKLSHADPPVELLKSNKDGNVDCELPSKRKSAIRAVNKFHEVLKQCDDEEDSKKKSCYVCYEKGVSKLPNLPQKIRGLWNKMKKEGKKIPCRRGSCLVESSTIQEAKRHHFMCSELPEKSYVCQLCDYYSVDESDTQQHVNIHVKADGDFTVGSDEERMEEEVELEEDIMLQNAEHVQNKSKSADVSVDENNLESVYKANFFTREQLINERQVNFCRRSLYMTLESEVSEIEGDTVSWLPLHTKASDWISVSPENAAKHLPSLQESISFHVNKFSKKCNSPTWRKLKRFEADIVEGSPILFTGGSILAMSWCKVSCIRSSKQTSQQYLAVSSSRKMDKFQDVHEVCKDPSGLLQIWDCGEMKVLRKEKEMPKMVMGIVHDGGEVWDVSWCPLDTYKEGVDDTLTRIGLLGAACQDGRVRIWSVCDPQQLKSDFSSPIFKSEPCVILQLEDEEDGGCLRLAFGRSGTVVGGYTTGIIAVWNLKNVLSPFCKRIGESYILKPHHSFQAHRTSITALSICPNSDRFIMTSGLDRNIKFWDLECTISPFECLQKEVCLDNVWPKHWPMTISTFEDILPCAGKGMIKAIRDAYCDTHRAPLAMDNTCWGLSFNEWMNVLCGCNNVGEVRIRYLRNMFLADEKFRLRNGNAVLTTEFTLLKDFGRNKTNSATEDVEDSTSNNKGSKKSIKKSNESKAIPVTYDEANQFFGLIFNDNSTDDSGKKTVSGKNSKKEMHSVEEYPLASVNKVCWNPNYSSFTYLAIGYKSGFVRIKRVSDSHCDDELSKFFRKAKETISKCTLQKND